DFYKRGGCWVLARGDGGMKREVDGHIAAPLCSCSRKTSSKAYPLRRGNHPHARRRPADGQRASAKLHSGRQVTDNFRCAADMRVRVHCARKNIEAGCIDDFLRFWETCMGIKHANNLSILNNHIGVLSPVMSNHLAASNKKIDGVHFIFLPSRRAV